MNLQIDSRKVEKGDIFFCLKGSAVDGHDYAEAAANNGAGIIVYERDIPFNDEGGTLYIKVQDTLAALNEAADSFYGFPSKKLTMFGVTGTNGKSSISYMLSSIYSKYAGPCGYMGTIGGKLSGSNSRDNAPLNKDSEDTEKKYSVNLTTPGVIDMHRTLADMVRDGAQAAAIEVSSHGLVQGRVDAVDFDYAIYTNLTREHLDYFHDMDTYCEAKALLFKKLKPDAVAIINQDDQYASRMMEGCTCNIVTYGIDPAERAVSDSDATISGGSPESNTKRRISPNYMAKNITSSFQGMEFDIVCPDGEYHVKTDMHVTYNLYNLLAVAATLHQAGLSKGKEDSTAKNLSMENIIKEFVNVPTIPGRMTNIDLGQKYKVIVDYAHTDDSYEQLLRYVKEDMPGVNRIITINGAPGKRDKENRKSYAKWIGMYGDYAILTEEDPRDEDPANIAKEIASYLPEGFEYEIIPDRYEAIRFAIKNAVENDVILILGKGAENYQDRASGKEYWMGDDMAAREILEAL